MSSGKRKVFYACVVILLGLAIGTFLFWLINGQTFKYTGGGSNPESTCSVPVSEKFDCHPDRPISEKECIKRGCCYKPASDQNVSDWNLITSSYLGVPSCFFPTDYKGYEIGNISTSENGIKADLLRKRSSGFPDDIERLNLAVTFIDANSLRIKLQDADKERFETPVPLHFQVQKTKDTLYSVDLTSNGVLSVTRKSNGAIVFKSKLAQVVFSNQFLQISSLTASNYLYGLGEHKEGILKSFNWTRLTLFNQGDLPVPNRNLYGSHPFYLVMEPGGLANGVFLLNSNAIDAVLQPAPAVTLRPIGGIFDFFIMLGPTPTDVVNQYANIVGQPFMPPYWSLGFHICKYGYFTLNKTEEVLQRNLDKDIPIEVQWVDIDYMKRYLDFTYDPKNFKGLPKFVDNLHKKDMYFVAMISPGVSNTEKPGSYAAYDDAEEQDLFVKDINGSNIEAKVWNVKLTVFPDFSNPATPPYWAKQLKDFHSELHFDGVWLDMNEPLNFLNGTVGGCPNSSLEDPPYLPGRPYPLTTLTLCMTAKHNATSHYNEHNLVAYREASATYNALVDIRKKRPFIISRASFSGQGVHSGHWSGDITSDWEDMRYTIPSTLIFNMYAMPMMGSDICGFRLNTTEDLCARWQALGAFYPFSRNHNDFDTVEQDPAAMGENVINATKNSLRIRYYLLPYLYTLFYRSHISGDTVARPLFFEFPKDRNIYAIEEQFLWGPALLINPVLYEDTDSVKAYFPKGLWYDFQSGEKTVSNGDYITLTVNITDVSVVVRGGYILPMQLPEMTTTASRKNDFDLFVALDEKMEASGELYWDDGDSLNTVKDEKYNLITFALKNKILEIRSKKKGYVTEMNLNEIKVYGISKKPASVTINDKNCTSDLKTTYLSINAKGFSLLKNLTVKWN